jgi:hypothetical protein
MTGGEGERRKERRGEKGEEEGSRNTIISKVLVSQPLAKIQVHRNLNFWRGGGGNPWAPAYHIPEERRKDLLANILAMTNSCHDSLAGAWNSCAPHVNCSAGPIIAIGTCLWAPCIQNIAHIL